MTFHAAVKFFLIGGIFLSALPLGTSDANAKVIKLNTAVKAAKMVNRWNGKSNSGEKDEPSDAAPSTAASKAPHLINGTTSSEPAVEATPVSNSQASNGSTTAPAAVAGVVCIAGCYHQNQ